VQLNPPRLRKSDPWITINLSTLVEGYAADQLSAWLSARFPKPIWWMSAAPSWPEAKHGPWVCKNTESIAGDALTAVVARRSGDHRGASRKHFEKEGQRYSHILDPRTGKPVKHGLVSVSVFHGNAMMADGYDTALLVLRPRAWTVIGYETSGCESFSLRIILAN